MNLQSKIVFFVILALSVYAIEDKYLVVIDPGHGGADRGAVGVAGLEEKEVTLDIAKRLKRCLEASRDLHVLLTREEDRSIPFQERQGLANSKGADTFISLHANASRFQEVEGFEVWCLSIPKIEETTDGYTRVILEDLKSRGIIEESLKLADLIRQNLSSISKDRGIMRARLLPLADLKMPAVLIEIDFITNPIQEHRLKDTSHREKIAKNLAEAILKFRNHQKSEEKRTEDREGKERE